MVLRRAAADQIMLLSDVEVLSFVLLERGVLEVERVGESGSIFGIAGRQRELSKDGGHSKALARNLMIR